MMERVLDRAAQLVRARQSAATDTVAAALKGLVSGARVSVEGGDVVASGKGLLGKWLNSAELRFLADAVR